MNKLIFDCVDRQIILNYYKWPELFSSKPIVVINFKLLKARKEIQKSLEKTLFFKFIENSVSILASVLLRVQSRI